MAFERFFGKNEVKEGSDVPEQSGSPVSPSRRNFIKGMGAFAATFVVGEAEGGQQMQPSTETVPNRELPEDYWFEVISDIYKEYGAVSPLQIRAMALIDRLEIPSGQTSSIGIGENGERENIEKDAVIAKYLTNSAGVQINSPDVTTSDFRALYPEGLPLELRAVMDLRTLAIMDVEYNHRQAVEETGLSADVANVYMRLFGVDIFLKGCVHNNGWLSAHGEYLSEMAKYAEIVATEGYSNERYGDSLKLLFQKRGGPEILHFPLLMRKIVQKGFNGLFSEVDARDISIVNFDREGEYDLGGNIVKSIFPDLPDKFFLDYYTYIKETQPKLAEAIISPEDFISILKNMSNSDKGLGDRLEFKDGVGYFNERYVSEKKHISSVPSGLEFGQMMFTDALAALKLQMTAKLMSDGEIDKGPIIDFEGASHIYGKTFFIRHPQYAMEVVLRTVHELTAGDAIKQETNSATAGAHAEKVFGNPDWADIVRKIGDLPFAKVFKENDSQTVEPGENQMPIVSKMLNFWDLYGIDPATVLPDDNQIKEIMEKFENQNK